MCVRLSVVIGKKGDRVGTKDNKSRVMVRCRVNRGHEPDGGGPCPCLGPFKAFDYDTPLMP